MSLEARYLSDPVIQRGAKAFLALARELELSPAEATVAMCAAIGIYAGEEDAPEAFKWLAISSLKTIGEGKEVCDG